MKNTAKWFFVSLILVCAVFPAFANSAKEALAKGNSYVDKGQYQEAIDEFSKTIAADPKSKSALCNRAYAYSKLDRYYESIEDSDQAIKIDPQFADAYYNRACAYGWLL